MVKEIKFNGFLQDQGSVVRNGKKYRFLTSGSKKKTVLDYVNSFNPDLRESILLADVDLSYFDTYGRWNPKSREVKVNVVKNPLQIGEGTSHYQYRKAEYVKIFGVDRGVMTPRNTDFALTITQARQDIAHYRKFVALDKFHRYPQYNEFLIVPIKDRQYNAYYPEDAKIRIRH